MENNPAKITGLFRDLMLNSPNFPTSGSSYQELASSSQLQAQVAKS